MNSFFEFVLSIVLILPTFGCAMGGSKVDAGTPQNGQQPVAQSVEAKAEPAGAQQTVGTQFRGNIGTAKFEMDLKREGGNLTGSYYYDRSGSSNRLTLNGKIAADGSFTMQEYAAGKQTGEFKGKWKEDPYEAGAALEGEWFKPGQKGNGAGFYAYEQMNYFRSTQVTTRRIKEAVKAKKATLSAEYPELSGNANAAAFNLVAKAAVMKPLAQFRKALSEITAADVREMGELGNYIDVGYNIEYADEDLISVSFLEGTFTGGVHPNYDTYTLTYDLKQGRELKLADLFKPGSKYINAIAAYAIRDLKGRKDPETGENRGLAQDIFEEGAKPTEENYSAWNITRKGLMITFPPYQVASYADGVQTVIIPYSALRDIARPDGILATMASKK